MMKLKSLAAGALLAALSFAPCFAQGVGQLGAGQVWANPTASQSRGRPTSASAYFDFVYGNTRGAILERGAAGWGLVGPGTNGQIFAGVTGGDPAFVPMSQDCTIANTGAITCTKTNSVAFGPLATQAAPCLISQGCTGQTTAPAARASSGLNVDSFTGHGDSAYTILPTDRTVGTNAAFTASRTWTLPAANAVNPGQEIIVADYQGTVTGTNTLVISRAGTDTVNGVTSITMTSTNGAYLFKSDGISKWTAQALGAAAGGGVASVTCENATITTSGTCGYIGEVKFWPLSSPPPNFVTANGASENRAGTFAALFTQLVKSSTVTFTNGSAVIGWSGNTLAAGDKIKFFTTGGLPTNFTAGTHGYNVGTEYCVLATGLSSTQFEVSATCGGTAITAGSAGTGTQTAVNAPWGDGDGSTTFTLPNLVGDFIRTWQDGTGSVDATRQFGAEQLDAFQGHFHNAASSSVVLSVSNGGTLGNTTSGTATFYYLSSIGAPTITVTGAISDGTNGTPRTAAETRGRNQSLLPIIRYQ